MGTCSRPPHSLHLLLRRWCEQMLAHLLASRSCGFRLRGLLFAASAPASPWPFRLRAPTASSSTAVSTPDGRRETCVLKGIAEGTYNTKHAEAAKPYYTTRYPHTHTQTQTQTCTCLYGGRHNRLRDHDIAPAAPKFKTFRREVP